MSQDKKLMEKFKAETGKNAIWHGKITKGFLDWKKKQGKRKVKKTLTKLKTNDSVIIEIQSNIQKIFSKLNNFEYRLRSLENIKPKFEKQAKISENHFFRILKTAYNSSEKKFGDFVSISVLTDKIKEFIPWSTEKVHTELYKLFMKYKIDLQPGKNVDGTPLIQDGKTFVWFKLKQ
jgi:V8-like Glu-specific endopeptidase